MSVPAIVLQTPRLILRQFSLDDAAFIFALVNDPEWLKHIGDRNVRNLDDARGYIDRGMQAFERQGYGMGVVELRSTGEAAGIAGLIKRDGLEDVDLGFAYLPQHRGRGYASESAAAVLEHGTRVLGMKRIVAIVSEANQPSIRLLEKLGMRFERMIRLPGDDEEIRLYATSGPGSSGPGPLAPSRAMPSP
ncbi:MAG TPA: GNAT family N-acetyltransferase [Candidatus Dormibacteraeota bacterium]|nr:GNAT family N-acetyltransferase [Candidatus Dormibacteraeota bacterium]